MFAGIGSKDEDEDSAPLLILEYMPYGDLQELLESYRYHTCSYIPYNVITHV